MQSRIVLRDVARPACLAVGRLQHLAVPTALPRLVDLLVARFSGLRAHKRARAFRVDDWRLMTDDRRLTTDD
jgi:hypothetical protein